MWSLLIVAVFPSDFIAVSAPCAAASSSSIASEVSSVSEVTEITVEPSCATKPFCAADLTKVWTALLTSASMMFCPFRITVPSLL
jgi:hypothetical protein